MDGSQYPSNGINTTSAPTYPSPTAISPNQLQSGSPLPQTLPPLQPPASAMQPIYGSNPHTPRTPGTPNTPNSTNNLPSYQPQTSQPGGNRGVYSMPPQNQYPSQPGYATSGAMMPQTTTASSGPQPIAPAPAGSRAPPVLRPMPPGGVMSHHQPGVSSPYGPGNSMMQPQPMVPEGEQPTHVVGSQGRRGILPSAPGRPAAPAAGAGPNKSSVIPVKDADGKFPCPHCTKTYLHAKHLKRHLLRHTGDRPYMCVLCRDTFSRSDILKRHFQKCSIRRGNPTGVSHLSLPQAHVKKNQQKTAAMGNEGDLNQLNGLNNMPQDGMAHPFGMVPVSDGMNNMGSDQNHQLSRSSSIGRLDNPNGSDRRTMTGPVMGASQPYGGSDVSSSMSNQPMPSYNMPPGQNGMPMYGGSNSNHQSGLDWSQMFQAGAHQTYINNSTSPNLGQMQTAIKTEPDPAELRPSGHSSGEAPAYLNWGMPSDLRNPYKKLSDQILNFFYPSSQAVAPHLAGMNLYFSPDNIKDFLDQYTHFHIHTPVLHVPTFRVMEAYVGLLAAMCCIGACYSERLDADHVRQMMDFLWNALERDCSFLSNVGLSNASSGPATKADTEKLQAVLITAILSLWNGNPRQRERARHAFPVLAVQAKRFDLFSVSRNTLYSPLHQPNFDPKTFSLEHFDWEAWIEQERRVRVMLGIFLGNVAMGLYFNMPPHIDPFELHVPLPCDDAAWDAETAARCASTLGLCGPDAVRERNPFGTRRATQPELHCALKTLLHSSIQIQPGSTNLYGKFVLIHAIIAQILRAQTEGKTIVLHDQEPPPPNDWVVPSKANSGRATPVRGAGEGIEPQSLKALSTALDKFKYSWDVDMVTQFPPATQAANNPKRSGFSRDGIHFYWLAKYVLKYTIPEDLQLPADARFIQVITLLKSVRSWVMRDGASRGEELGSIGEIDEHYGTTDLTLDMAKLFRPLPQVVGDAGTASVKTELGAIGNE